MRLTIYLFLSVLLVVGISGCNQKQPLSKETANKVELFEKPQKGHGIVEIDFTAAKGQEGKTLMDVIKSSATVDEKDGFITGINDMVPDEGKKEFIAIYVNGKQAQVGANDLKLKNGDKIEFKLETWK